MGTISKAIMGGTISAALMLSGYAQSNTQKAPGSVQTENANIQGPETPDANPLAIAIEMNLAEVELGKLGSMKTQNGHIKTFADMITKDHTQALEKLRAMQSIASSEIKLNPEHEQTTARLAGLSGNAFDREYMNVMVAGHEEAIRFLEEQSRRNGPKVTATEPVNPAEQPVQRNKPANDAAPGNNVATAPSAPPREAHPQPDLSSVALELLPVVREHLEQARRIQGELAGTPSSTSGPSPERDSNSNIRLSSTPNSKPDHK